MPSVTLSDQIIIISISITSSPTAVASTNTIGSVGVNQSIEVSGIESSSVIGTLSTDQEFAVSGVSSTNTVADPGVSES